jgi:drug/metabolite transporter (DMT)-like permease
MEVWFILSCLSAVISSVWSVSVESGLRYFSPIPFASWYAIVATIIIGCFVFYKSRSLRITKWGAGSGIGAGIAAVLLAKSFAESPNPGFSMALFRMQSVLTAIASYFLYKAPISPAKILGMLIAIIGVIVLSTAKVTKKQKKKKETFKTKPQHKEDSKKKDDYRWVLLALGAGVAMTCKDIFTKNGLIKDGPSSMNSLLWGTALLQSVAMLIVLFLKNHNLDLLTKEHIPSDNKNAWFHVILAGLAFSCYQFTVINACKHAPNIGLVKAIDTLGIVITTVVSYYMFGSGINTKSIIGMALVVSGVIGLSYNGQLPGRDTKLHHETDAALKRAFDGLSWGGATSAAHGLKSKF